MTTNLKSGPPGPSPQLHWQPRGSIGWSSWAWGALGEATGLGEGCRVGFRNVCTVGRVPDAFCGWHTSSGVPGLGPGPRWGFCAQGLTLPEHKGRQLSWGRPGHLSVPSAHLGEGAWGSGVGMSSSSTMFSGWNQRRGGARHPRSTSGVPQPRPQRNRAEEGHLALFLSG